MKNEYVGYHDLVETEPVRIFCGSGLLDTEKKKGKQKIGTRESPDPEEALETDERPMGGNAEFTDYALVLDLTNRYTFGRYGSQIYVRDKEGVYSPLTHDVVTNMIVNTLTEEQKQKFNINRTQNIYKWICSTESVKENELAFPVNKILFKNGLYNIKEERPAKMKKKNFIVARINARFLPDEDLECPFFDAYLETVSGGDESIKTRICVMIGYLLLPGYPGKKIIVIGTAKDSGKSMLMRFIQMLIGPELVSGQSPFEMSESHALAEFFGKMMNTYMDLPAVPIKPTPIGVLKTVTGGDVVSVNPKNKARFSQICFAKQVLGTNAPLRLVQYDEAFWERVEVVPYRYTISKEKQIPNLERKLMKERDAIVTKCIRAVSPLLDNNYTFPPCPVADEMKDSWIGWQRYATYFLNAYCTEQPGAFTGSTRLYEAYSSYCRERTLPVCPTQKSFIQLAQKIFPCAKPTRKMRDGDQCRGLNDVFFNEDF